MHLYTMTIIEETEVEDKLELKLWENTKGMIWIQIGYDDNDPCTTQGIPLTKDDAHALMDELFRLIKLIESRDDDDGPVTLTPPLPTVRRPLENSTNPVVPDRDHGSIIPEGKNGKQLTLTPPCPDPDSGQVPIPSKVNWNA